MEAGGRNIIAFGGRDADGNVFRVFAVSGPSDRENTQMLTTTQNIQFAFLST
jgi:hypothetical protein